MSLLQLRNLSVTFPVRHSGAWPWTPSMDLRAVRDVSLEVAAGETLGIVGESGSGKSTLARAVIGTVPISGGAVFWDGTDLAGLSGPARRPFRKAIQMIFQDPLAALNPRMTVGEIIAEPLRTHGPEMSRADIRARVGEIMERVGLLPNLINRYPHEFSGGQCQRIGIARALILSPRLVVCDEPVSALDVSVQAQVVNLLKELQADLSLSLIFISHDLSVVRHISDRIAVMYLGSLMEVGDADQICKTPQHPYSQALISSVPIPDPALERARTQLMLEGDLPSPLNPPAGCPFQTRCPKVIGICSETRPELDRSGDGRQTACHLVGAGAPPFRNRD